MFKKAIGLLLIIFLCVCLFAQKAQNTRKLKTNTRLGLSPQKEIAQYQCDEWKKDKGLPQNTVFDIIQSEDGYLWLATYEGLARFDGVDFSIFNTANVNELQTSGIWTVYQDREENIWLGTNNGGLTRFHQGKFTTFTTENGLPSNTVNAIQEDTTRGLWVGTNKGLCLFREGAFKVFNTKDGLSSSHITALHFSQDGTLWVGTNRGLTVYQNRKFKDYTHDRLLLFNRAITSITEDAQGHIWIGTHAGLVRWHKKNENYQVFRTDDGLSDDYITEVYLDSRGSLWIGTQSEGLNRIIARELDSEQPRFDNFRVKEGLSSNSINAIYEDREGSLWIGLSRGGLNRLRDGKFTNYTTTEGLSDNITNCVYQDKSGGIWIGTVSGGISYLKDGKFLNLTKAEGISSNHVRSVLEDQAGHIWIATYGAGVDQLTFNENMELISVLNYSLGNGLAGNVARSLYEMSDGSILVGTHTGLSIYRNGEFVNYTRKVGLSENSILGVYEDSEGNIWTGTDGGGLNCIRKDNTFINYNTSNGLANDLVFAIYEDKEGSIWIGTRGGISRIKDGELVNIYAKDGLAHDAIHGIMEDNQGRLWMSSNSGVFYVEKKMLDRVADNKTRKNNGKKIDISLECVLLEEEDGMKSSDCAASAQPSLLKDQAGHLWFPTTEGVTTINPARIKINYIEPKVDIKRIVVDNQVYDTYQKINLPAGASKFEIDFAALSFLAPSKVKYRYRLKGTAYKEKWVEVDNKRDAYYTNLPPGHYTFQVQASNNDGVWNREGASLKFYIAPFFYQTTWFYVLIILLALSLGFGLYYWRVHTLEQSKKALEKGIAESTQKIRTQYAEITQQAEELKTVNNIVRTINQEVKFEKVLKALLEQGLLLFSSSNQGIFLVRERDKGLFHLIASCGYRDADFDRKYFSRDEVIAYCQTGLHLDEGIYRLQPSINLRKLAPDYKPKSSLAMQIEVNEQLEGVIFFDNSTDFRDVSMSDIEKLTRFKEHAVSAFVKARILLELENKNEQIETSYRKISDSIRYARRIQKAILPTEEEISRHFEEIFVFYQPKDIVSGDFYWFAETVPEPIFSFEGATESKTSVFKGFGEMKTVLAAVDCTGHGVPGAFMTVIGNDLLNSIVIEDKTTRAHRILDQLDKNVKTYLKQEEGGQSRDGMDMSLMVIDEEQGIIEFAGAKNPLYYIRNEKLHQIKGSKHPIGGAQIKKKVFSSIELPYQPGDVFYMFSDGFPDQFGGPNDRKYGSKRFRDFLLKIHQLPLPEQKKQLENEINQWKGENKQTDDILVIGLKI